MSNSKKHYHLVAGEVKFGNTTDETIGSTLLNALLPWDTHDLPLRAIGRAQQALQIQFRNRIQNDPTIQIIDVVIVNFSYLGFMTEEEFNQAPEGTKMQERPASVVPYADDPFKLN
jgi:hypothetical protein